jgi:alcohol dehydrogenase
MLVTGRKWARETGLLDKVSNTLNAGGKAVSVFEGVHPEPPCYLVDDLREKIKSEDSDLVVGLGGGSALDVAKAAAILVFSSYSTVSHLHSQKLPNQSLPMIAIVTVAGTGSEATPVSVLIDSDKKFKHSIRSEIMIPKIALVDPELMISCSRDTTAASGMDAFVQAVEAFCSKFSTNLSDSLTEKAISLLAGNLVRAYHDGSDISAREAVADASLMAGMALANVRLGAVHAIAHPIGGKYDIPHGLVCGILLPTVLEFNKPALYEHETDKYARLCNILMADPVDFSCSLLNDLDFPKDFKKYKIKQEDIQGLAEHSMLSGSLKANPRDLTIDDMKDILHIVV